MKKSKTLLVIVYSVLLLIPFGTFTRAQPLSYVGVQEDDIYTWKVDLDVDGIDELMTNVEVLLDDIQAYFLAGGLDLGGYEDMTIIDIMDNITTTVMDEVFPGGWETLNVTELLEVFIGNFIQDANSTMFGGNIPDNWGSLNVTTFADYVVDGLDATLPAGWDVNPIPELIKSAINTFNNSLLFGFVPDGWEGLTVGGLLEGLILPNFPEMYESFILHVNLNQLNDQLTTLLGTATLEDMISSAIPLEAMNYNVSFVLDMLNYSLPPQYQSVNMSTLINILLYNVTSELPSEYMGTDMSNIIGHLTDEVMENITALYVPEVLPVGFQDLPLKNLLNERIVELINQWDTVVVPQWTATKVLLTTIPSVGFRIQVISIGTEIEAYVGGPRGVPIELEFFVSVDFKNWTSINELFGSSSSLMYSQLNPLSLLGNLSDYYASYIVNPATYSSETRAFGEQGCLSGGLIIANNYNLESMKTNFSIQISGDPNGIFGSAEWNTVGVLREAYIEANGVEVVRIALYNEEDEIPGYEVAIVLALTPITITGLIYFLKKKNRIKNLK